jgi:hypothetical protein
MFIPYQRNLHDGAWYLSDVSRGDGPNLVVQTAQGHTLVSNSTQATKFETRVEALAVAATLTKGSAQ